MTVGVGLDGDQDLVARLARTHDGILDLSEPNRDAARLVDRRATLEVPRATGALASSETVTVTATSWGITYTRPYAPKVHWGTRTMRARPWLTDAARATEEQWMDVLEQHVDQLLG